MTRPRGHRTSCAVVQSSPRVSLSSDETPLRELLRRVTERWHPRQVWLFGSRARSTATAESDWDVFVVVPDELPDAEFDPIVGWRLQQGSEVYADVIACRASDFEEDATTPNTLAHDVMREGVRLV